MSGTYGSLWVYLTAPFVGSILGWAVYRFLTPPDDEADEDEDEDKDYDDSLEDDGLDLDDDD